MNMDNTKVMSNVDVSLTLVLLGGSTLEDVDDYIYLEQTLQQGKSNFKRGQSTNPSRLGCVRKITQRLLVQNTTVSKDETLRSDAAVA